MVDSVSDTMSVSLSDSTYLSGMREESKMTTGLPEVLKRKQNIFGEIEYSILNESDAICNITTIMDRQLYEFIQKSTQSLTRQLIIIDRSGSMYGEPLRQVKECALKLAESYYSKVKSNNASINLQVVAFDTSNTLISAENFDEFKEKLKEIDAGGGTRFSEPLQFIHDEALQGNFVSLNVLFLTDGLDGSVSQTEKLSKKVVDVLQAKKIQSKFSVIGIDDHDAGFMTMMSGWGMEQGRYDQCRGNQPLEERASTIKEAFEDFESSYSQPDEGVLINVGNEPFYLSRVASS